MIIFHINDLQIVEPGIRHAWHVGFLFNGRIIDAHPRYGVSVRPYDEITKHYHRIPTTRYEDTKIMVWLATKLGCPFGDYTNTDFDNRQAWTCLELITAAFEMSIGWKIYTKEAWNINDVSLKLGWDCGAL